MFNTFLITSLESIYIMGNSFIEQTSIHVMMLTLINLFNKPPIQANYFEVILVWFIYINMLRLK